MVWIWMLVALLGEMGLALFFLGAVAEMSLLGMASGFGGPTLGPSVTFSLQWWAVGALSAFLLSIGLIGLSHEQRVARGADRKPRTMSTPIYRRRHERPARAA